MRSVHSIAKVLFPSDDDLPRRAHQIQRYELLLAQVTDFTFSCPHPYARLGNFLASLDDEVAAEDARKRLQSLCGQVLNESYACPIYIVFEKKQTLWIHSILRVAILAARDEGVLLDTTRLLDRFSSSQRNFIDIELEAFRCFRLVLQIAENAPLVRAVDALLCEESVRSV